MAQRDTEGVFEHSLEDGPRYPLSVDKDAVRHAGVQRLQKVPGALRDMTTPLSLGACAAARHRGRCIGRSQAPRESFSAEFKEGYLCTSVFLFHTERVVLLGHRPRALLLASRTRRRAASRCAQALGRACRPSARRCEASILHLSLVGFALPLCLSHSYDLARGAPTSGVIPSNNPAHQEIYQTCVMIDPIL